MNFLDYRNFKHKISDLFPWQDEAESLEPRSRNSSLKILLNIDIKGESYLYRKINKERENLRFEKTDR